MQQIMEQWINIQILDFEWTSVDYQNASWKLQSLLQISVWVR